MAGQQGRSGRDKLPGKLYRLNIRFRPDRHSPELLDLLNLVAGVGASRAADILGSLAAGGLAQAQAAASTEATETAALLDDLFG